MAALTNFFNRVNTTVRAQPDPELLDSGAAHIGRT
jgi:hypothetical protein